MTDAERDRARWSEYYRAQTARQPRELLVQTLHRLSQEGITPGLAIDLGCGTGTETLELLRRGWRVLAVDAQADAIAALLPRVDPADRSRLETRVATFATVHLPAADLIWAGRSLPFSRPDEFAAIWAKVLQSLRPGGRFAGDLFGTRHFWAQRGETQMTFCTAEQVKDLCQPLELEYFMEEEGKRATVTQGIQHWHGFSLVARRTT